MIAWVYGRTKTGWYPRPGDVFYYKLMHYTLFLGQSFEFEGVYPTRGGTISSAVQWNLTIALFFVADESDW